jgi:hypothetical protein
MDMEWTTSSIDSIATINTIYSLETAVATFIASVWNPATNVPVINGKELLSNVVSVIEQNAVSSNLTVVNSTVTLVYAAKDGEEIADVASALASLVTANLLLARVGGILGPDVKSISFLFANNGTIAYPYQAPKGCSASKGLLIACVLLSIAVVFVSAVLLWVAGGWYQIRQSMRDIMRYNTEDKLPYGTRQQRTEDEDDESPSKCSGIIGANPLPNDRQKTGKGGTLRMTPGRGLYVDETSSDILSPMSQQTDVTDTSRPPLGIKSISKLTRDLPPDQKRERPHYAIRDERDYQDH